MEEHGEYRPLVGACLALAAAAGLAGPAAGETCRLALLLAIDVSSSVDAAEDALQREGIARALSSPEVVAAALAVPGQPVALGAFEWSGRHRQRTLLDWTLLRGPQDMEVAAARIAASRRSETGFPTALGYAIGHAASVFAEAPDCLFRTLDISGDGVSNDGFGPAPAYRHFSLDEVTVNGLAILGGDVEVERFYREQVIRGTGAFLATAADFSDIERAMRRKLEREMGVREIGALADRPSPR